jgi:spore coat polysaccharide biosynthesis protein SpsF
VKVVAVIQARMGSTRLPGKVLQSIGGATMLERVCTRVQRAKSLAQALVATTIEPADDAIVRECQRLGVPFFRGSEDDVLDRYYRASLVSSPEVVVRITSDCPIIDPDVVDLTVNALEHAGADYASNVRVRRFPHGLDTEVMTFAALERAWREASQPYERVHVTPYLYQHPELFRIESVEGPGDRGTWRWTVDTAEDLEFARAIYERLGNVDTFTWLDAVAAIESEPKLAALNAHIRQKSLKEC